MTKPKEKYERVTNGNLHYRRVMVRGLDQETRQAVEAAYRLGLDEGLARSRAKVAILEAGLRALRAELDLGSQKTKKV